MEINEKFLKEKGLKNKTINKYIQLKNTKRIKKGILGEDTQYKNINKFLKNHKIIKCKGYHKEFNPKKNYKLAKQPIGKFDEISIKDEAEIEGWIYSGGWIGLRLENLTAIDVDKDNYRIELVKWYIDKFFQDKEIKPVIQKTKNGYHFIFRQYNLNNKPFNNSNYLSKLGVNLTAKSGINACIIIEPSEGKQWLTEPDFDSIPELPEVFTPLDKDNAKEIVDAIVRNIAFCYQKNSLNGYEDIELSFCYFLVKEGFSDDYIHNAFKFIYPDYDHSRTKSIIERTKERLNNNEELKGIKSLFEKIKDNAELKTLKILFELY